MENEGAKGTIVREFAAREYPRRQVLAPTNGAGDTKSRTHIHKTAPPSLPPPHSFRHRVSLEGRSAGYAVIRYRAGEKLKVKHIAARKGERACAFKASRFAESRARTAK